MDRFLAPHSPEAQAHSLVTFVYLSLVGATHVANRVLNRSESSLSWDMEHPSLNETLIAGCASYQALNRYLSDADLVFHPRSRKELENIL